MQTATQPVFVQDSWQSPRNARTLRAFMALQNQEIGARLRELRGQKPQTVVAEDLGVAERTYQNWEAGDAKPSYRNLQRIAEYHGTTEEFILTGGVAVAGGGDVSVTLTPFDARNTVTERLDRIEKALERARREREEHAGRISAMLDVQNAILAKLEAAITRGETVTREAETLTRDLLVAVAAASRELRAGTQGPAAEHEQPAK